MAKKGINPLVLAAGLGAAYFVFRGKGSDKDYVGSGWTDWPHKQAFPNAGSFANALSQLGYQSPSQKSISSAATREFQEDYNFLADFLGWKQLYVNGLMNAPTIEALYWVMLTSEGVRAHMEGPYCDPVLGNENPVCAQTWAAMVASPGDFYNQKP